jgi:NADH-quinone oxidoreductase subunit N
MNLTQSFLRILPEVILTITGVVIMLIEPVLPRPASRKPLGWLAILGVVGALYTSLAQYGLAPGTGYSGLVQVDAFSTFFHVLICGIVLVTLLVSPSIRCRARLTIRVNSSRWWSSARSACCS